MNTVLTSFRDFVTSVDANKVRALFLPPGRYYGFDSLVNNGSSPANIPAKVTHTGKFSFYDDENQLQSVGAIVTRHGAVYLSDEERSILIPRNDNQSLYYHLILVAEYEWANQDILNIPNLRVLSGPYTVSEEVDFNPGDFLTVNTQIPIGVITVEPSGTTFDKCSYTPLTPPNFAGIEPDLSRFARKDSPNMFEFRNTSKITTIGAEAFFELPYGRHSMSLPGFNNIILNAPGQEYRISLVTEQGSPDYASVYFVYVKDIGFLEFLTGGSVELRNIVKFKPGDAFVLARFGNTWKIFASFENLFENYVFLESVKDNLALTNQTTIFEKGLGLTKKTASVSVKVLRLPEGGLYQLHLINSQQYIIDSIRRYINSQESEFPEGSIVILNVLRAQEDSVYVTLRVNDSNKDTFFINRIIYDEPNIEEVILTEGQYIFVKNASYMYGNKGWTLTVNPGALILPEISDSLQSTAQITWNYFSWELTADGNSARVKASITVNSVTPGNWGDFTLNTHVLDGMSLRMVGTTGGTATALMTVSGNVLTLVGESLDVTYEVDKRILL